VRAIPHKKYYKLVKVVGKKRFSARVSEWVRLEYSTRRWTKAKYGGLFVFSELRPLYIYVGDPDYEVWETQVRVPVEFQTVLADPSELTEEDVRTFWEEGAAQGVIPPEEGMLAFRRVRLKRRVTLKEIPKEEED
jgi:hypothetical protein